MPDSIAKALRLVALAILIHAVVYFVSHFRVHEYEGWRSSGAMTTAIKINRLTGSSEIVRFYGTGPVEQPNSKYPRTF